MTATVRDLVIMATSIPADSTWTATGIGKNAWGIAAATIAMGGHVRVGFEDNVYMSKGVLAKSNGEMVERVVQMAKLLNREVATPAEAREILGFSSTEIIQIHKRYTKEQRMLLLFNRGKKHMVVRI